jgi:Sulfotransferase family
VTPPLLVLGVRRSGTTLLRVMLDRSSVLAVPDESYFIPQLAHRQRDPPDPDAFVDDLRRIGTLRDWGVSPDSVRSRLRPGLTLGGAIAAVFETYAAERGKTRWGDKTPLYMGYLPLLERLFPDALYIHLIRDGRDAAVSFLQLPDGIVTRDWATPRSAADFACQWRTEIEAARRLGRRAGARYVEVRYEALVSGTEAELRALCGFCGIAYESAMLGYAGSVDVTDKPHQRSLQRPPTPGLRDWRTELAPADVEAFESIAGPLLQRLGYQLANPAFGSTTPLAARVRLVRYRALSSAWRGAGYAYQRSPFWRRSHPEISPSIA